MKITPGENSNGNHQQLMASMVDGTHESSAPVRVATTKEQWDSLAELPKLKRYALYESITEEDLSSYHNISCRPITVNAENDMVITL